MRCFSVMQAHQGFLRAFNSVTNATQTKNNIMEAWTTMSGVPAEAVTRWGALLPVWAGPCAHTPCASGRAAAPSNALLRPVFLVFLPATRRYGCSQGSVRWLQPGSGAGDTVRPMGPGHLPQCEPFPSPSLCCHRPAHSFAWRLLGLCGVHVVTWLTWGFKRWAGMWCRPRWRW